MNHLDYNFISRFLHQVQLGNSIMPKLSFEIENNLIKGNQNSENGQHLFVTGLARGGTTILLRAFYNTRQFVSLTYQNMPFVLAPNLWNKIKPASTHHQELKERAHGDGIAVNAESPEAFDEVFWKTFCGKDYIFKDRLVPHAVPEELIEQFKRYIYLILYSNEKAQNGRYLSKNNNNILRIATLSRAFPNASILIPFRHPLQHAGSLLNQQERFVQKQTENPFVLKYMNWLGHFEFGLGQRPFIFSTQQQDALSQFANTSINYWLIVWKHYYQYLLEQLPYNSILIHYDKLCSNDTSIIPALNKKLDLNMAIQPGYFKQMRRWTGEGYNARLLAECQGIYEKLISKSL